MRLKIYKGLFWLAIKSRWFKYWSKLYRLMFDRQFKSYTVEKEQSLQKIHEKIKHLKWKPDGFRELYDVCRSPNYGQYLVDCYNDYTGPFDVMKIDYGQFPPEHPGAFDCDDFASYCSAAHSRTDFEISKILLVSYIDETSKVKYGGHVVYIVYHMIEGKYSVLSNWGFEDKKYKTISEVVDYVLAGRELIGYAFYNNNLDLLSVYLEK